MDWRNKKGRDWLSTVLRSSGGGVCVALFSCEAHVCSPAMVKLDLLSRVFLFLIFFFEPPIILDLVDSSALDLFFQDSLSVDVQRNSGTSI